MRRLIKENRCGFEGYKCQGINLLPFPDPICCDDSPNPVSRVNDNNFYNIPSKFIGIVQQTDYTDLSQLQQSTSCCQFKYDPFTASGFKDLFGSVSTNTSYKAKTDYTQALANYGCSDSIYYSSDAIQEEPGFLLPSLELNDFYPSVLQAVPTVALASPTPFSKTFIQNIASIDSACTGFKIEATDQMHITVSSGEVWIGGDEDSFLVSGDAWSVPQSSNVQIYLNVWYDFGDHEWTGQLTRKVGASYVPALYPGSKRIPLGTVRKHEGAVHVIQQTCSPVDISDQVIKVKLPSSNAATLYVFSYRTGSTKKAWYPVKDCN